MTYVYVLATPDRAAVKVGVSLTPALRSNVLGLGCDDAASFRLKYPSRIAAMAVERHLLDAFAGFRLDRPDLPSPSEWLRGEALAAVRAYVTSNRERLAFSALEPLALPGEPGRRGVRDDKRPPRPAGLLSLGQIAERAGYAPGRGGCRRIVASLKAVAAARGEDVRSYAFRGAPGYLFSIATADAWLEQGGRDLIARWAPADAHKCSHRPPADVDNC